MSGTVGYTKSGFSRFSVVNSNVADVSSDILLLKHASGFFGVDRYIANLLIAADICTMEQLAVAPDNYIIINCNSVISPKRVLIIGTGPLASFGYSDMKRFAEKTLNILSEQKISVSRLTTTIHGAGYGLDAEESLLQLVLGFKTGSTLAKLPLIKEIIFVELEPRRAQLLTNALANLVSSQTQSLETDYPLIDKSQISIQDTSNKTNDIFSDFTAVKPGLGPKKRHVFVAMPFSEDFEDIYEYGIYGPVRNCGLICEKTSESAYTGDILQRITERIETADFVVAELSGSRPNVYLEVGYAWGKGVPVIFIARNGEQLHFDVSRHRCIYYKSIRQLANDLEKLLRGLLY
jgi:hypothetical protein